MIISKWYKEREFILLNVTAAQLLKYIGTNISGLNNSTKDDNVNLLDIIKIFYNPLMDINDFMVGAAVAADNNVFGGLLQALGGAAEPFQSDRKAFNLGKTVTDFTLMVAGAGAFIFGAVGGAGGVALDATGVGAIAGVPLTAAGLAAMSIGGGIAVNSAQNLVSDGLNLMSGDGNGSSEGASKTTDIFNSGKKALDNFDIDSAYVKPKHLSTTGGNGQKFLGDSKAAAESILKDAMQNGAVKSITDNGLTKAGNVSYEIIIDAGKTVGTRGETMLKVVISEDGGMLSSYPIK